MQQDELKPWSEDAKVATPSLSTLSRAIKVRQPRFPQLDSLS
jgi:hypothetical protein